MLSNSLKSAICFALLFGSSSLRLSTPGKQGTPAAAKKEEYPACIIKANIDRCADKDAKEQTCNSMEPPSRLVVVGDVHGSRQGLKEILDEANITDPSSSECKWIPQNAAGTILVQVGDIVDRGAEAFEAWKCLDALQDSAHLVNSNTKVVRMIGNHELWWLEGYFHQIHPEGDTKEKILEVVDGLKERIMNGKIVGAFVHRIHGQPIMFVHAGFRNEFLEHLKETLTDSTPEGMASYVNQLTKQITQECIKEDEIFTPCDFANEVFEAGPDRGGKGIGGPFWTDFHVIDEAAQEEAQQSPHIVPDMIQVVGHTMAWCYDPRNPEYHPPPEVAECSLGLIRPTARLSAVCVDGGMYAGARAFLEIGHDGVFRAMQRNGDVGTPWDARDLTSEVCA